MERRPRKLGKREREKQIERRDIGRGRGEYSKKVHGRRNDKA